MNIEEAKKIAKGITTDDLLNYWEGPEEPYKAIQVILNELDKNTEIISDLQNEVTIKDAEIERLKEYEYMYKDLCN